MATLRPIAMEILRLVWQAVILYVVVLFIVRLMGKRSVGKLAPFDLAVIIMIGELVAIPVTEERELYHGLIPVVVLGLLQLLLTWANTKSRTLEQITQGTSTLLVKDGQPQMQGLTRERVTLEDLAIALREKEVENLADVKEAYLEPTGQISVLKQKDAQPVTPRDAQLLTLQRLDQVLQQNLERTRQEIHRLLLKAEEEQTKGGEEGRA
ncbi:MAG: YetF domain-containing protein [Bacillota bacterium]